MMVVSPVIVKSGIPVVQPMTCAKMATVSAIALTLMNAFLELIHVTIEPNAQIPTEGLVSKLR